MTRGSAPTHGSHGQERERKWRRLPGTARGSRSDRGLSSVQRSKTRQSWRGQSVPKKETRRGRHLAKVSNSARGFVSDKDKRERESTCELVRLRNERGELNGCSMASTRWMRRVWPTRLDLVWLDLPGREITTDLACNVERWNEGKGDLIPGWDQGRQSEKPCGGCATIDN
jgi:hypothetical protein